MVGTVDWGCLSGLIRGQGKDLLESKIEMSLQDDFLDDGGRASQFWDVVRCWLGQDCRIDL